MRFYRYLTHRFDPKHRIESKQHTTGSAFLALLDMLEPQYFRQDLWGILGLQQLHWGPTTIIYNQYLFSVWLSITVLQTLRINFKHRNIPGVYLYVQWWVISATSSHPKSLMTLAWTLTFSVLRIPSRTVVRWFQHLNFTGESRPTCFMVHPRGMGLAVIWNKSF